MRSRTSPPATKILTYALNYVESIRTTLNRLRELREVMPQKEMQADASRDALPPLRVRVDDCQDALRLLLRYQMSINEIDEVQ